MTKNPWRETAKPHKGYCQVTMVASQYCQYREMVSGVNMVKYCTIIII